MPQLKQVVEQLGETANLATLDGDRVIYVSQAPSPHAMRMFTEVGRRSYLHSTSVGKAILAGMTDEQVREIVARTGMPANTEHTITDVESLLADLAKTRKRGYAVDDNEQEIGVRCFAVAVPDMAVPTAVSVSGPVARVSGDFAERALPVLEEIVAEIAVTTNQ
ncbi:MAG: IclR family transcriptional regulator, partial [Microbacterium sp.]